MHVRELREEDRDFARERTVLLWGSEIVVSRGRVRRPADLTGFVAVVGDRLRGLATYVLDGEDCELVTIDALDRRVGIGTALLAAVEEVARTAGGKRVRLVTSNDNLDALRFYQRRGYRIVAVHAGAIDESRKRKPSIPRIGHHGIPVHDELELRKGF